MAKQISMRLEKVSVHRAAPGNQPIWQIWLMFFIGYITIIRPTKKQRSRWRFLQEDYHCMWKHAMQGYWFLFESNALTNDARKWKKNWPYTHRTLINFLAITSKEMYISSECLRRRPYNMWQCHGMAYISLVDSKAFQTISKRVSPKNWKNSSALKS